MYFIGWIIKDKYRVLADFLKTLPVVWVAASPTLREQGCYHRIVGEVGSTKNMSSLWANPELRTIRVISDLKKCYYSLVRYSSYRDELEFPVVFGTPCKTFATYLDFDKDMHAKYKPLPKMTKTQRVAKNNLESKMAVLGITDPPMSDDVIPD